MSIREEIENLTIYGGGTSKVDNILAMLDDDERTELQELLADKRYTSRVIAKALSQRGGEYIVSERTVQRYRQDLRGSK